MVVVRWFHFSFGLLGLGLTACQQAYPQPLSPPAPLPQAPHIQAYFNQVLSSRYTDPYRQQERPGDDFEQILINAIASAQTSIDVAVQEFRLPRVAQALRDRQQAGVQIRVILENTYSQPYSAYLPEQIAQLPEREKNRYDEAIRLIDQDGDGQLSPTEITERDALIVLDQADIPRIDDTADGSAGSNLMHHKFMVVDGKTVISTSANWTMSDVHGDLKTAKSRGNANNLLQVENSELAAAFTNEFNLMWGDGPGRRPDSRFGTKKPYRSAQLVKVDDVLVQVQFSPSSRAIPWQYTTNGLIGRTLQRAKESINFALFVFSDQQLVNRMEPLHQSGVEIRALIEPGFAFRPYRTHLGSWKMG
ncbi:MAG TPA: competence protein ComE [Leptolyngbyaceae cyanobacterium M33_DOE_097]|uniref:phospholipase D n=1 Tax=Oscillatoriales cyanobacterium SpSt-418 TaxID=2282169 RepID=A0A7C3KFP7_9CYAN|nr:competence protein ComE [Leptolyngbyaceae cyanobacterium M33_DOE_097]